jgi:hypothetical protein
MMKRERRNAGGRLRGRAEEARSSAWQRPAEADAGRAQGAGSAHARNERDDDAKKVHVAAVLVLVLVLVLVRQLRCERPKAWPPYIARSAAHLSARATRALSRRAG